MLLDVGVEDADAFVTVTVTVGLLAVAVSEPPPTETFAVNVIVSPAGAVLGTLTEASICGADGWGAGRVRSQLVCAGLLAQLSTVNTGWLKVGLFALGVSVVVIVPASAELDQAEMRNRMVPPACTLVSEAVTATAGLVGGVGVGVADAVAVGDAAGAAGADVALAAGADEGAAVVGDAADAPDVGVAVVLLVAWVADGAAVADGEAAASAVPLMLLEMTKIPVAARPSVTGRACGDRMTPCLWLL